VSLAPIIITFPLPNWNRGIWENQTSFLSVAFNESEICEIYLHCHLDELTLIYYRILRLRGKEEGNLINLFT
jgi:hypothetical protein